MPIGLLCYEASHLLSRGRQTRQMLVSGMGNRTFRT
jgi:hypothetical protein